MKPVVFIGHVHTEAAVALWLKEKVSKLLLQAVDFFVSSDGSSIVGGDPWLRKIEDALKNSSVVLVLCSRDSVLRPWVNFEAGGAWMAGKRVVPVCLAGMTPKDLPEPLRTLQTYELSNPTHLQNLVSLLATAAGLATPDFDAQKLADSIPSVDAGEDPGLLQLSKTGKKVGTGWLMPEPDPQEYTDTSEEIAGLMKHLRISAKKGSRSLQPSEVDLREWCSRPRNQGRLNSSTAHAIVGMIEYLDRRSYGRTLDLSRLFVYKHARNLLRLKGDSGATLKSALQAVRTFGVPASEYWPYTDKKPDFDAEPPASLYSMGFNYQASLYFCHDPRHLDTPPTEVLAKIKAHLAAGMPSVFGLHIFSSFEDSNEPGVIPLPGPEEQNKWRQAVLAVGYDDNRTIAGAKSGTKTKGALLFQNSWGEEWGDHGYGWLPYECVLKRQALDFWSFVSLHWLDTGKFDV